jgi:hypothetical protein
VEQKRKALLLASQAVLLHNESRCRLNTQRPNELSFHRFPGIANATLRKRCVSLILIDFGSTIYGVTEKKGRKIHFTDLSPLK